LDSPRRACLGGFCGDTASARHVRLRPAPSQPPGAIRP
jgi:hypothetical protein